MELEDLYKKKKVNLKRVVVCYVNHHFQLLLLPRLLFVI